MSFMNLDSDVEKVKQRGECVVVGMKVFGAVIRWKRFHCEGDS